MKRKRYLQIAAEKPVEDEPPYLKNEKKPDINDVFLLLLKEHTAGDPMDEKIKWTNLTCADISIHLAAEGFRGLTSVGILLESY